MCLTPAVLVCTTITQDPTTKAVTAQWNAPTAGTYYISLKYRLAERGGSTGSQPDNRSLQLHDDRRAWFDQWNRSRDALINSERNSARVEGRARAEV